MKEIRSKENPTYRQSLKLLRKKYRDQTGRFLIEGPKPVADALNAGAGIEMVYISESLTGSAEAAQLDELCRNAECDLVVLPGDLYKRLSDTDSPQGVTAQAIKPEPSVPAEPVLILDRLQDPGNIGTIIRTAEAAGFGALIAIKGTGDIYSPKTVRAAAGSLLRVNVFEGFETDEALSLCNSHGLKIIASDLEGSVEYTEADMTEPFALVIGNEGSGISSQIRQAADVKVRIPMEGNIESLNAATAAGILMYEAARQRRSQAAGKVK